MDKVREKLPSDLESALASAEPDQLAENVKKAIYESTKKALIQAFLETATMKQFYDKVSEYMEKYLRGEIDIDTYKRKIYELVHSVNWTDIAVALDTTNEAIESLEQMAETAKETSENLAASSVRAVTEETANILVRYTKDMRDALLRIDDKMDTIISRLGGHWPPEPVVRGVSTV